MMKPTRVAAALLLPLLAGAGREPAPAALEVDVLVYGATSGGVMAAYTAKQYGKRVLLVEPGRHLGGMSSGGLGQTDIGNKYAVTGLGLDFYRRLGRYYGQFEAWQFEPRAAEQVFEQYLDEAGVEILFSRRLRSVEKEGTTLRSVTLEYAGKGAASPDLVVHARQFIDASYEGDLLARAGASFTVGREANSRYGESIDGVQLMTGHQFPDGVDPYRVPGRPASGLLPEISAERLAPDGSGDRKVQAYNFRMALCQGEQRVPLSRPDRYRPERYELLLRLMEKRPWRSLDDGFIISRMPNGKTDWNNRNGFSTDFIGGSWEYPEADYATRERIWREHEDYQKGLLWFLGTDARVPEPIRRQMQSWGYCRDEFLDTGGWPHQLYVREARRLVGEYVMSEHEARGARTAPDAVAMAAYTMDSHNAQRLVVNGMVKNEGNVEVGGFPPYPISYRALTPKRAEVTNLLVPVALSATHIAYGSIRMEPVFMVLGQAAAVAASMAIDAGVPVQGVDVARLQGELRENPLADHTPPELLVDDRFTEQVTVTGPWAAATVRGQYGPSVLRGGAAPGAVRFTPRVVDAGRYRVYLYVPRVEGQAPSFPVEIRHAAGTERLAFQPVADAGGVQHDIVSWQPLGEFRFEPGGEAWLEIRSEGAGGAVIADAVLFVPVRE